MKKILSIALVIGLLLSVSVFPAPAVNASSLAGITIPKQTFNKI